MIGVILGIAGVGTLIIKRWDAPLPMNIGGYICVLAASVAEGITVMLLTKGEPWHSRFFLSVIGGALLLAVGKFNVGHRHPPFQNLA